MTKNEYEEIQERLSKKLKGPNMAGLKMMGVKERRGYNEAILSIKSMIREIYRRGLNDE